MSAARVVSLAGWAGVCVLVWQLPPWRYIAVLVCVCVIVAGVRADD